MSIQRFFLLLTLSFSLLFLLFACKKQPTVTEIAPEILSNYISGYTTGVIGKTQPLRIQFASNIAVPAAVGEAVKQPLLTISPKVEGSLVWESERGIVFTPNTNWEPASVYTATVHLKAAYDTLRNGPEQFSFQFSIQEPSVRIAVTGLYTPNPSNLGAQAVGGQVQANDRLEEADLAGLITASQLGKSLAVSYLKSGDMTYDFVVSNVVRGETASEVVINWDAGAKSLGNAKGSATIEVPALSDFKVLEMRYEQGANPHISIRFSDPLLENQDFTGLVTLPEAQNLRYQAKSNLLQLFVEAGQSGSKTLRVHEGIQNAAGKSLGRVVDWEVNFIRPEPQLRSVGDGVIMPYEGARLFPFEAIGLVAVKVEVFKIFENNIQQFLQENQLDYEGDSYSLQKVGRVVSQDRVLLSELDNDHDLDNWKRYALDLSKLFDADPKAIYQVRIGFGMEDIRRKCDKQLADFGLEEVAFESKRNEVTIGYAEAPRSIFENYYGIYGYYQNQAWEDREDPCKPAYYNAERFISRNLLSSNLGLIVKQDENRRSVIITTNLRTGQAAAGVEVQLFDAQRQPIFKGVTDATGFVEATTAQRPDFATAAKNKDLAYLKLDYATALPLDKFNVGGVAAEGGIKGQFYGERGVWRPGDSVFLNFVLEDRYLKLPPDYPLAFSLYDAKGRLREERSVQPAAGDMYALYFKTDRDDPTGNWRAVVEVAGKSFTQSLKIETIKPNRLRIDLDSKGKTLSPNNNQVTLRSTWLHGATASGLQADAELEVSMDAQGFDAWPAYVFRDPSRYATEPYKTKAFEGTLDEQGMATFSLPNLGKQLPGRMKATFKTRVFEPGGGFSVDNITMPFMPFNHLAGLYIPKNKWGEKRLIQDQATEVNLLSVDQDGKGVANRKLSVGIYQVRWRYWWEDGYDNISRYSSSDHKEADQNFSVTTDRDGRAKLPITVSKWGRYLVKVCDTESGHCSADYAFAGSPSYGDMDREAAAILRLQVDKEKYAVGETVSLNIPASEGAMILVSLENSAGVLQTDWIKAKAGDNTYTFKADERMLPNVYVHVELIEAHGNTSKDRPLRMYGIVPVLVEDPATRLQPLLATADEYQPEQEISISLSEQNGKAMTYTLAVVDEGLLGLTRFATPDLWTKFFAKEALSVRTFDLFNQVISAGTGSLSRVLSIGGDEDGSGATENPRANRFEPVVRHLGPFQLAAGKKVTHKIKLPNYIGAVKVMAVVAGDHAYGKAEKIVPVRKPLMILPTLPRVLGPGEEVRMPVNVFAMTDKVKNVQVSVRESSGKVTFLHTPNGQAASQQHSFSQPGDATLYFPIRVGQQAGIATFEVTAQGNGEKVSQTIEIDIRNPNTSQTATNLFTLQPGETRELDYSPFGSPKSRRATLEVASLPTLNVAKHFRYILGYPYGCSEQTSSKGMALLHLDKMLKLSTELEESRRKTILNSLNHLVNFLHTDNSATTWPGGTKANPWVTSYMLHYLIEAEKVGFKLPLRLKDRLLAYQKSAAANWQLTSYDYYVSDQQRYSDQAYRLFTLALAQQTDLGAMNRLRSNSKLSSVAAYHLAGAYALAGQKNVAKELIANVSTSIPAYREYGYTYGSSVRDMAMILDMQLLLGELDKAGNMAVRLANAVNKQSWLHSHEVGLVLSAMSKLVGQGGPSNNVLIRYALQGGKANELGGSEALLQVELPTEKDGRFTVTNLGKSPLFASIITQGQPLPGDEKAAANNLKLVVAYTDLKGNPLDVSQLKAGTDFYATYTVTNPGTLGTDYREMALNSTVASGWEIVNDRMDSFVSDQKESYYEYRDYQDASVATFFHLPKQNAQSYRLTLTAAYPGRYYLPSQMAEAMYDQDVQAATMGKWVVVAP